MLLEPRHRAEDERSTRERAFDEVDGTAAVISAGAVLEPAEPRLPLAQVAKFRSTCVGYHRICRASEDVNEYD